MFCVFHFYTTCTSTDILIRADVPLKNCSLTHSFASGQTAIGWAVSVTVVVFKCWHIYKPVCISKQIVHRYHSIYVQHEDGAGYLVVISDSV